MYSQTLSSTLVSTCSFQDKASSNDFEYFTHQIKLDIHAVLISPFFQPYLWFGELARLLNLLVYKVGLCIHIKEKICKKKKKHWDIFFSEVTQLESDFRPHPFPRAERCSWKGSSLHPKVLSGTETAPLLSSFHLFLSHCPCFTLLCNFLLFFFLAVGCLIF